MSRPSDLFYFNINNHDIEVLISKISSGDPEYTLDKMIENGLFSDKIQLLTERLAKIQQEELQRRNEENDRLQQERNSAVRKQTIIDFCNQIADNQKGLEEIKISILNGIVSLDEMSQNIHETRLSQDVFNKIGYYISAKKQVDFYLWKDLPPLLANRTDIYFFGQPASGKSCILANLFSYIDRNGFIIENTHSLVGTQYKNIIQYEYDLGYLPERTAASEDGVNYITFELTDPENNDFQHPLNFIEMSGELFDQATVGGVSDNNLNAKNYLNNKNRKLIFFVVDYDRHVQNTVNPDGNTPQGSKMLTILSLLDQFGTFKQTDGIYILVSKSDLFPSGEEPLQFAEKFLNDNYKAFIKNCKNIKEKYKGEFEIKAYPYSIGSLILKSTFVSERDYKWSEKVINEIVAKSFGKKSKRGLFGFFS